jgi:hypothetical protein
MPDISHTCRKPDLGNHLGEFTYLPTGNFPAVVLKVCDVNTVTYWGRVKQ